MTHSVLTNQIRLTPGQFSYREGAKIDTFLIHHQAGTNDDATINAMVSGSRKVSANYTISNEGRLTLVVDEDNRAWTSGSSTDGGKGAAWDRRSITVEIENETAGPAWLISAAAIETAAKLLLDLRKRYRISNVLGHRDLWNIYHASYVTYCPGPNTVAAIQQRAAQLGDWVPTSPADVGSGSTPAAGGRNITSRPTSVVQQALVNRGIGIGASGVDGVYGPATTAAVAEFQKQAKIGIDGIYGPQTDRALFGGAAVPPAPATGITVDGVWGPQTTRALQAALHVAVDGIRGPQTIRAQQARTGATVDGIDGPNTRRALQRYLGVTPDGAIGPITVRALQTRLNAGTF